MLKYLEEQQIPEIIEHCENNCKGRKKILQISDSTNPMLFSMANYFLFHSFSYPSFTPSSDNKFFTNINEIKSFPWENKYFDYVFCKNVIDKVNSYILFSEIIRISKAGHIETSSPLIECTKNIDYFGYHYGHNSHKNIIWMNNNTFNIVDKFPLMEYIVFPKQSLGDRWLWNSYFDWDEKNELAYNHYSVNINDYPIFLQNCIEIGKINCLSYKKQILSINSSRKISEILEGKLYLTGLGGAEDFDKSLGIEIVVSIVDSEDMVINLSKKCADSNIDHYIILCSDNINEDIKVFFNNFIKIMDKNKSVLVHCKMGFSRSVTLVWAYLLHKNREKNPDEILDFIRNKRPEINPNSGFIRQINEYHSELS